MPNSQPKSKIVIVAKWVITLLSGIRLLPHIAVLLFSPKKDFLWGDLDRWGVEYANGIPSNTISRIGLFVYIMTFYPEYRNVFYFRHRLAGHFFGILCWPMRSLRINARKCGRGLFIHHGFGTRISVEEMGENCSIGQLVTIGYVNNSTDRPTIGNNVTVAVGARVLGGVKIGDNSTVGPNSVVIMRVPSDATVMGVPAAIVWRTPK